jgi:hypothetical protein
MRMNFSILRLARNGAHAANPAQRVSSKLTGKFIYPARTCPPTVTALGMLLVCADERAMRWVRGEVRSPLAVEEQRKGFSPSVPFVACLSACMVVAELVKFTAGWNTALETRYQLDMLTGPAFGSMIPQNKRQDCECFVRRRNIDIWRQRRALKPE